MTQRIPRRAAIGWLRAAAAAPLFGPAEARPLEMSVWKTAVGLNGFQSGTRKYHKNYPIWEVLDWFSTVLIRIFF